MKIIYIGLVILGIAPVFVILALYVYKLYIDNKIKKFNNSGNRLLTWDDISTQSDNPDSIRIFKSAVDDHMEVNGLRYYTKYPFGSKILIGHDNHRRSLIAHQIGQLAEHDKLTKSEDLDLSVKILLLLTDSHKEAHYTQLIVWNSLSKFAPFLEMDLVDRIGVEHLKNFISGEDYIKGIGIVKFLFNIKDYKNASDELTKFINDIIVYAIKYGNRSITALLVFKLFQSNRFDQSQKESFLNNLPKINKFNTFIKNIYRLNEGFLEDEMIEGLKSLGLQPPPYSKNNTEGEIVQLLLEDFLEDIYVSTSYWLYSFMSESKRERFTDFLWFEEKKVKEIFK